MAQNISFERDSPFVFLYVFQLHVFMWLWYMVSTESSPPTHFFSLRSTFFPNLMRLFRFKLDVNCRKNEQFSLSQLKSQFLLVLLDQVCFVFARVTVYHFSWSYGAHNSFMLFNKFFAHKSVQLNANLDIINYISWQVCSNHTQTHTQQWRGHFFSFFISCKRFSYSHFPMQIQNSEYFFLLYNNLYSRRFKMRF